MASTNTTIRERLAENGNLPTEPRQVAVLAEDARRNAMKPSQSATTARVATLNAQGTPTKSLGPKRELQRPRQHCRRRSAYHQPKFLFTIKGATFAT
jgi:hypothetical protein